MQTVLRTSIRINVKEVMETMEKRAVGSEMGLECGLSEGLGNVGVRMEHSEF